MKRLLNLFGVNRKMLEDVFTPSNAAKDNYIRRTDLEKSLDKAIKIPGTQMIVYGHSGSGKTTLVRQALMRNKRNFVKSSCISETTIDQLIINAFDQLDPYYTSKRTAKVSVKIDASVKANYLKILEASRSIGVVGEAGVESQRVLPVQLSFEKLAEFLNAAKCVWVIDDFHKVSPTEKAKIADIMKAFVDISDDYPVVKIIAIGAANSPRGVVSYNQDDSNLMTRLSQTLVPLLSPDEIKSIMNNGADLLNIRFSRKIIDKVTNYSNSLGSICHRLAYNLCNLEEISKTCRLRTLISDDKIKLAVEDFVKDQRDTYQEILDHALMRSRVRSYHNVKLILEAILKIDADSVSHNDVITEIRKQEPEYPPGNCTTYLQKLTTPEYNEILRRDGYGNYSFSDPFFMAYCKMVMLVDDEGEENEYQRILDAALEDMIYEYLNLKNSNSE